MQPLDGLLSTEALLKDTYLDSLLPTGHAITKTSDYFSPLQRYRTITFPQLAITYSLENKKKDGLAHKFTSCVALKGALCTFLASLVASPEPEEHSAIAMSKTKQQK